MKMHVLTLDHSITPTCVRVQKPYIMGGKSCFELYYSTSTSSSKVPLIIQSPICIMPYSYSLYDDKYLQVNVQLIDNRFIKMMEDLKRVIYKKITRGGFDIPTFESSCTTLRLYNKDYESVGVFDNSGKPLTLKGVVRSDKIYVLFQVEKLVISTTSSTLMFKLLQIKKADVSLTSQCMIGGGGSKPPPPPPPGPPPPPPSIFKPIKLDKKIIPLPLKKQYKPPSLKEILDAKSKLKNVTKVNDHQVEFLH